MKLCKTRLINSFAAALLSARSSLRCPLSLLSTQPGLATPPLSLLLSLTLLTRPVLRFVTCADFAKILRQTFFHKAKPVAANAVVVAVVVLVVAASLLAVVVAAPLCHSLSWRHEDKGK